METLLVLLLLWNASQRDKMQTWARGRAVNLPENTR